MSNKESEKNFEKKEIEIVSGDGKNLDISPVYDHVIIDKPISSKKKKNIIIPKEKKNLKESN